MFKREMKINLKSFLIWMSVLIGIFLVVFLMYPSIINGENGKMIDEMMELFPSEVLKMFNMDIASMNSAFGWIKTEGFVFALLIIGCYSGMLGSNILLKEENDKTIEYLNTLPIKRKDIVLSKIVSGLIYIFLMIVILMGFNYICLLISEEFDQKQFFLLSITPFFSSFVIFFICMFLSTFTHKSKKMLGLSLGIVLLSYVFQMFSQISDSVEFFKYFSVFTLSDVRGVIINDSLSLIAIAVSVCLSLVFMFLTLYRYNKKELV